MSFWSVQLHSALQLALILAPGALFSLLFLDGARTRLALLMISALIWGVAIIAVVGMPLSLTSTPAHGWGLTIWCAVCLATASAARPRQVFRPLLAALALSLCLSIAFTSFYQAHFSKSEIEAGIDPWESNRRLSIYPVIDQWLQWQISQNFYNRRPLEDGFMLNGNKIWSAGDRPILVGFLNSTLATLTGRHHLTLYYLLIIALSSGFALTVFEFMRTVMGLVSRGAAFAAASIALFPFFFFNVLYTWPKILGLTLALGAATLLTDARREHKHNAAAFLRCGAGLGFALALLCHPSALFAVLLAGTVALLKPRSSEKIKWRRAAVGLAAPAVCFAVPLVTHHLYIKANAQPTGLMMRVNFCRSGSFAYVTRRMPLMKACYRYLKRSGWHGVAADRAHSLQLGFVTGWETIGPVLAEIVSQGGTVVPQKVREWVPRTLFTPPFTSGPLTMLLVPVLWLAARVRKDAGMLRSGAETSLLGVTALIGFCLLMGEFSELSSHVVPFAIPLFIQAGVLVGLYALSPRLFAVFVSGKIALGLSAILLHRSEVERNGLGLALAALATLTVIIAAQRAPKLHE